MCACVKGPGCFVQCPSRHFSLPSASFHKHPHQDPLGKEGWGTWLAHIGPGQEPMALMSWHQVSFPTGFPVQCVSARGEMQLRCPGE